MMIVRRKTDTSKANLVQSKESENNDILYMIFYITLHYHATFFSQGKIMEKLGRLKSYSTFMPAFDKSVIVSGTPSYKCNN